VNPAEYANAVRRNAEHIEQIRKANNERAVEWKRRDDLCSTCGFRLTKIGGTCAWDATHPQ